MRGQRAAGRRPTAERRGQEAVNAYEDYGIPGAGNVGRFQYTGQAWLGEVGLQYSRARIYSPTLGRFLQTDPIGYGDGLNWYNYVGADPVNATDPSGLCAKNEIEVNGECVSGVDVRLSAHVELIGVRNGGGVGGSFGGGYFGGFFSGGNSGARFAAADDAIGAAGADPVDVTVTARRGKVQANAKDKWIIVNGRYVLNSHYVDPAPWLNLNNIFILEIGAFAAAGGIVGTPFLAEQIALSRTFGVASTRFGNAFYRSGLGAGSWNRGYIRLGWSYHHARGTVNFQPRVGSYHVPTPISTLPPGR